MKKLADYKLIADKRIDARAILFDKQKIAVIFNNDNYAVHKKIFLN